MWCPICGSQHIINRVCAHLVCVAGHCAQDRCQIELGKAGGACKQGLVTQKALPTGSSEDNHAGSFDMRILSKYTLNTPEAKCCLRVSLRRGALHQCMCTSTVKNVCAFVVTHKHTHTYNKHTHTHHTHLRHKNLHTQHTTKILLAIFDSQVC